MPHPLFERHAATIERALAAIAERGYWSPYSESPSPKVYGEGAAEAGKAAFDALLGKPFALDQPGTVGTVGREVSPFGLPLGISLSQGGYRPALRGDRRRATRMAEGGTGSLGRRLRPRSCTGSIAKATSSPTR